MEYLAAAGVAAVALLATIAWARARKRGGLLKKATSLLEWGDLKGAATLFEQAGEVARAASLWAEAGERRRAVELLIALKSPDAAVEALRGASAEDLEEGVRRLGEARALVPARASALAALARTASQHRLAANLFEQAGNGEEARACRLQEARSLAAAGKHLDAATLYDRLNEQRAAAAARAEAARREVDPFKKRELAIQASQALERNGDVTGAAEALAIGGALDAGVALLLKASNVAGAAQLLQWNGQHSRAGELFEKAGDFKAAARAWGHAGDKARASKLLEKAGDCSAAAQLLLDLGEHRGAAEVHARGGNLATAVELLLGIDDVDAAVRLYEEAGKLDQAVELLSARGRPKDAAALLQRHGEEHRASELLAASGDLTQKAKVLVARGDYEGAAQAFLELGQPEDAKAVLAHASRLSPLGRFLLARACMAADAYEEAVSHFSTLLGAESPGVSRIDAIYGMARSFETLDRTHEAITSLEEVVAIDPEYRDAFLRLRLLRARLAPAPAPIALTGDMSAAATLPPEWGGPPVTTALTLPPMDGPHRHGVPPRYQVEKELGRGSMGVVYRALDQQLGRTVAIKVLEKQAGADPRIREYFLREARAIAQLTHPNIVTLFDAGLEGSAPYLVMELVDGDDLRTRLQQSPLNLAESLRVIGEVASALDYAHGRKIVHRDVKPENILVSRDGTAKLMDFGVAHVMHGEGSERHATVIGTPVYMAPEQIKGEGIGGWTDTYAIGAVLFECLTGQPPFEPGSALYHHVNTPAPDPRSLRPELPAALAETVLACLAKDPRARPARARDVSEKLAQIARALAAA